MSLRKVSDPSIIFKYLNGVINIYKPSNFSVNQVKSAVLHNICRDLNELSEQQQHLKNEQLLLESGGAADPILRKIHSLNVADQLMPATAHKYEIEDIRCAAVASLGRHTSGVLLFGLNKGIYQSMHIQRNRPIRAYHVTGCLGVATENHLPDSRIICKSNYKYIRADRLSDLASSLQASHQRKMYELCGVDMQSQAAYEIACKGLIRPADTSQPVIYGIKLVDFKSPSFTLEIHAINETEEDLALLIHEIGIELKSVAHCTALRCIRHGQFVVESSLLRHGWNLPAIVKNMREQKTVLQQHPYLLKQKRIELTSN